MVVGVCTIGAAMRGCPDGVVVKGCVFSVMDVVCFVGVGSGSRIWIMRNMNTLLSITVD